MKLPKHETHYSRHLLAMHENIPGEFPQETEPRFRKWLFESLLYALAELEDGGDTVIAMRCLLQVHNYLGRLGGFWPTAVSHDAAIFIQNALEDRIRAR